MMNCEVDFKRKLTATVCYVTDRDIGPLKLNCIDVFNVLELKIQSVTGANKGYQEMVDFDQDDDLSRFIDNKRSPNEETVVAFVSVERDIQHALVESIRNTSVSAKGVRKEMALKFFSPNGLLFHQKMIYLGFTVIEIH
ncbi:unnamed protein product [Hymenolepis diminuta]|uniref:Uncharacterized protein n=1 Tax=Hymenolepis diminuta TaxID=6216 RepID=A0A564YHB4_HYMDI|nr:unnamed protein product [Hymenolepis diminuta]